jgi:hypothetical protein
VPRKIDGVPETTAFPDTVLSEMEHSNLSPRVPVHGLPFMRAAPEMVLLVIEQLATWASSVTVDLIISVSSPETLARSLIILSVMVALP